MDITEFEQRLSQYNVEIAELQTQLRLVNEALAKKHAEERAVKKAIKEEERAARKAQRELERATAKAERKEKRKEITEVFEEAHQ